jgi:DNA-binding NarL/FixJ family response regulator
VSTRLLLIEDNPGDAIIFREKLNESDLEFELVHTQRLKEGLDLIAEQDFDLILCDLSLPDASGLEAVVQVRRAAPKHPIIVLTGLDDATTAAQARHEGVLDYLVKWYQDGESLARYIRYAIAHGNVTEEDKLQQASNRRKRRAAAAAEREPAEPENTPPDSSPPAGVAPSESAPAGPAAAAPAGGEEPLRAALEHARDGIAVVDPGGRVLYANAQARAWMGGDESPWPVTAGARHVVADGIDLEQVATETEWQGRPAFAITLHAAHAVVPGTDLDAGPILEAAQSALSFVEDSERRSRWMADVLSSALDLEQQVRQGVEPKSAPIDLHGRVQQAVRDHRSVALERGMPVRVRANREKVMVLGDRHLIDVLLRRLVLDALLTARPAGVDVELLVDGPVSQLAIEWDVFEDDAAASAASARKLARQVVIRLVDRLRGRVEFERAGGRHRVVVRIPGKEGSTP